MAAIMRPGVGTAVLAAVSTGVAYQGYRYNNSTSFVSTAHAESLPSDTKAALKKMEWKGFTELKLESAEMYNHNVKRLTFALPDDQTVSGNAPISKCGTMPNCRRSIADQAPASLLTQHTPEGAWIPVFRPYTPVSTSGEVRTYRHLTPC